MSASSIERWRQQAASEERYAEKIPELWEALVTARRRALLFPTDSREGFYLGLRYSLSVLTGRTSADIQAKVASAVSELIRS